MSLTKVKGSVWDSEDNGLWVNVKDYGAVGDGSTDDAAAINLAITYAASQGVGTRLGGTVYFPPGNYILETAVVLKAGVILQGAGINATTLQKKTQAGTYWMIETDGFTAGADIWLNSEGILHGFGIKDMALYGAGNPPVTATDRGGIRLYGKRYFVDNVLVHNVDGQGFYSEAGDGVGQTDWRDMPEGEIKNLFIYKAGDEGFVYRGPHDGQVTSVFVSSCGADGVVFEKDGSTYAGVCDVGIVHSYANVGRGIVVSAPIHAGTLIGESNLDEGIEFTGTYAVRGKVDWVQLYSNLNSSLGSVTATAQMSFASAAQDITISNLHSTDASTLTADTIDCAGKRITVDNIKIEGNATATGSAIKNTGNYNSFTGTIDQWSGAGSYVLELDGGSYCKFDLRVSQFETLIHTSGDYRYSNFSILFFEDGAETIWDGTTPTLAYRNACSLDIHGKMNGTDYGTKSQGRLTYDTNGFLDIDSGSTGLADKFTKAHTWETQPILTPDISEMHVTTYWNGADSGGDYDNYNVAGPFITTFDATSVTVGAQVNSPGVTGPTAYPQAVISYRMGR